MRQWWPIFTVLAVAANAIAFVVYMASRQQAADFDADAVRGADTFTIETPDGWLVDCVRVFGGGVDCDWERSRVAER